MTPRIRPSALFAALTAAVLALFLWTAFREVQATLWRSAGGRAQAAADQLAAAIANTAERRVDEIARAATDPAVRHSIVAPTALTRQAARRGLESLLKGGQDTLELWTSTGERVLQIGTELPARAAPTRAGLSMLQESHGTVFYEVVAEVQPRSGYLAI